MAEKQSERGSEWKMRSHGDANVREFKNRLLSFHCPVTIYGLFARVSHPPEQYFKPWIFRALGK